MQVEKYIIDTQNSAFGVELPIGAKLCGVGVETGTPYLYALGDQETERVVRTFAAPATLDEVPWPISRMVPMGAVVLSGGARHVFELIQPS